MLDMCHFDRIRMLHPSRRGLTLQLTPRKVYFASPGDSYLAEDNNMASEFIEYYLLAITWHLIPWNRFLYNTDVAPDLMDLAFHEGADMAPESTELVFSKGVDVASDFVELVFREGVNVPPDSLELVCREGTNMAINLVELISRGAADVALASVESLFHGVDDMAPPLFFPFFLFVNGRAK